MAPPVLPSPEALPCQILRQCRQHPEASALVVASGQQPPDEISYGQLRVAVLEVAALLRRAGVGRGAVVAVLLDEAPGSVLAELGVWLAGGSFVPLDPASPRRHLLLQLRDCSVAALLHSPAQHALAAALVDVTNGGWDAATVAVDNSVCVGVATQAEHTKLEAECLANGDDMSNDICYIIYTSGSTGVPKGVVCDHGAIASYAEAKLEVHHVSCSSRVLLAAAATWDPSVGDAFSTLAAGACLVVAPRARLTADLHGVLLDGHVTHVCTTPALWRLLPPTASWQTLPELRIVALGGEPMPASLAQRWMSGGTPTRRLLNTYGVTEAAVYQTAAICCGDGAESSYGLAGVAFPGVELVVDAPSGEAGEIFIGGRQLSRGYLNDAELTAEKFVTVTEADERFQFVPPGRWFRTGDLGQWTQVADCKFCEEVGASFSAVSLRVLGRVDRQLKLRGVRIEPGEVEAALLGCCEGLLLREAIVTVSTTTNGALTDEDRGSDPSVTEQLVGYVVPSASAEQREGTGELYEGETWLTAGGKAALLLHCRRTLPPHAVPTLLVTVPSLPLTTSGKVDRAALPPPVSVLRPAGADDDDAERPSTPLELRVASVWSEVLGIPQAQLRLGDNFFELGGTSATAVAVIARLQELEQAFGGGGKVQRSGTVFVDPRVRFCALYRKQHLREYAQFLSWATAVLPEALQVSQSADAEALLNLMAADLPSEADEQVMLGAALSTAARCGYVGVARALLELKAPPNGGFSDRKRSHRGATPLSLAAAAGHVLTAKLLVEAGAATDLGDSNGRTPAMLAAAGGYDFLLRYLLRDAGCRLDTRDDNQQTVLHWAAWHGKTLAICEVLQHSGNRMMCLAEERHLRESCSRPLALLNTAQQAGITETELLKKLADYHEKLAAADLLTANSIQPFCAAVIEAENVLRGTSVTKHCGDAGGPTSQRTGFVEGAGTPVSRTAEWWSSAPAAIQFSGSSRRVKSERELSTREERLAAKTVHCSHALLNSVDRWRRTPLAWALFRGHVSAARLLLAAGSHLDFANPFGTVAERNTNNFWSSSLHLVVYAAGRNAGDHDVFEGLRLLLAQEEVCATHLEVRDDCGRTALHLAAEIKPSQGSDGAEGVRLLLAAGASPHARDDNGATVLQYAERVGQQTAAQLLLAAGAQTIATTPSDNSVGGKEPGGAAGSVMWASTSSKLRTWGSERTQRFEKLLADKAYN